MTDPRPEPAAGNKHSAQDSAADTPVTPAPAGQSAASPGDPPGPGAPPAAAGLAFLRDSLDTLQVNLSAASHTRVGPDWIDRSYTPGFSKFYYILQGHGRLRVANQTWEPRPGELCLLPEGINQGYQTTTAPEFTKYWCHFSVRLAGVSLFDLLRPPWSVQVPPAAAGLVAGLFDRILRGCQGTPGLFEALDARAALLQLVVWYLETAGEGRLGLRLAGGLQPVARAMAFMQANYARPLDMPEVAAQAGLHPASLSRLFRRQVGLPPVRYLARIRLAAAAELLGGTSLSLDDVAARTGFADGFYLSRLFRQAYGQSPGAWRQARRPGAPGLP